MRNLGVDLKTLHLSKLYFTRAFNFLEIVYDCLFVLASFVSTCKIMLVDLFQIIKLFFLQLRY